MTAGLTASPQQPWPGLNILVVLGPHSRQRKDLARTAGGASFDDTPWANAMSETAPPIATAAIACRTNRLRRFTRGV